MHVVPVEVLLSMTELQTHEVLLAAGSLVDFDQSMGHAMFVSHQWVDSHHPDPDLAQFRIFQDALRNALSGAATISSIISIELITGTQTSISAQELSCRPVFIWYDYFSCPQSTYGAENRRRAINSIPEYVGRCKYFVILCPRVRNTGNPAVDQFFLSRQTWEGRGVRLHVCIEAF